MRKRILSILSLLLVICMCFSLSACSSEPVTLDFENYEDSDLFKLINREVEIFGYFMLNPGQSNTAYVTNQPYQSLHSHKTDGTSYTVVNLNANDAIMVKFKEQPEYTSLPIKIVGTLEAGPFTDQYYLSFNYRIKDAVVEPIDFASLPQTQQQFYLLAQAGFTDVMYEGILNLDMYINEVDIEYPTFEIYKEVVAEFDKLETKTLLEEKFLEMLNELNNIYEKYKPTEDAEVDMENLTIDINAFFDEFNNFITTNAGLSVTANNKK